MSNLHDFIARTMRDRARETTESGMGGSSFRQPTPLLLDPNSERIPLQEMDSTMRTELSMFAAQFFEPETRKMIVLGSPKTGKTFTIEQFAHNIEEFAQFLKKPQENIKFLRLTDFDILGLGSLNNIGPYIHALCSYFECHPSDLCFVTESPDVAIFVNSSVPVVRIILESNSETLQTNVANMPGSLVKAWESWKVYDLDEHDIDRRSLVNQLWTVTARRINETYSNINLQKTHIAKFVDHVTEYFPNTVEEDEETGEKHYLAPTGLYASAINLLCSALAFDPNHNWETAGGKKNFTKIMHETAIYGELFMDYTQGSGGEGAQGGMPENLAKNIMDAIRSSGMSGNVVIRQMGVGEQDDAKVEVTPLKFKDVSNLEKRLKETIIGQNSAVKQISESMIIPAAKLHDEKKPLRSLLFLGTTGVGKTQVALDLAKELADTPMNVVRIDMSEFQQSHEVAKLFGAPPGYVGFESGGILTDAVMKNPHSVVLLDEVEKAHPKVWDAFLQVLDSGRMTSAQGEEVDFSQTVIIMTSNIGAADASREKTGFGVIPSAGAIVDGKKRENEAIIRKALQQTFREEMINRFDEIVIFESLSQETAREIVRREINLVGERMKSHGVSLAAAPEKVIDAILTKSNVARFGAREIQRTVSKSVSNPIAHQIVRAPENKNFVLSLGSDDTISVTPEAEETKHD